MKAHNNNNFRVRARAHTHTHTYTHSHSHTQVEMPDNVKKQVKNASSKQLKLEIGVSPSGGVAGGAGGAASSPVFKSQPVTPPSSDTNYLFDSHFGDSSAFGALLMPATSMGFDFQNHDSHSCVEVSSTSIMGAPDDMTVYKHTHTYTHTHTENDR